MLPIVSFLTCVGAAHFSTVIERHRRDNLNILPDLMNHVTSSAPNTTTGVDQTPSESDTIPADTGDKSPLSSNFDSHGAPIDENIPVKQPPGSDSKTSPSFDFGGNANWSQGIGVGDPLPVDGGTFDFGSDRGTETGNLSSNHSIEMIDTLSHGNTRFDLGKLIGAEKVHSEEYNNSSDVGTGEIPENKEFDFGSNNGLDKTDSTLSDNAEGGVHFEPNTGTGGKSPQNKSFEFGLPGDWNAVGTVPTVTINIDDWPSLDGTSEQSDDSSAELEMGTTKRTRGSPSKPKFGAVKSKGDLRPLSERSCSNDVMIACIHGYCHSGANNAFECICDTNWTGMFCEVPCPLACLHGQCSVTLDTKFNLNRILTDEEVYCNCQHEWTGDLCDALKPDPQAERRVLAAVLGSALAVLLFLAILLPVLLWRMRVVFVMKLVYFMKQYEDDDGKLYDAYVSMSPTSGAENFVYKVLRPKMEDLGFKLYLQARDQPIGALISDSILQAIEQSRRTILVVTQDYVKSEWSRFEYHIAQRETLKLEQRIIPVILDDIDEEALNNDKSLQHILRSIKCLKCPQSLLSGSTDLPDLMTSSELDKSPEPLVRTLDLLREKLKQEKKEEKFWKRLELTMPKIKSRITDEERMSKSVLKKYDISNTVFSLDNEKSIISKGYKKEPNIFNVSGNNQYSSQAKANLDIDRSFLKSHAANLF